MVGLEAREGIDNPATWLGKDYAQIIELRSYLLRSKKLENIHSRSRFVQDVQELALAKQPADVELHFSRKPLFSFSLSDSHQPMGPSGQLRELKVAGNISIKPQVERVVRDELKAGDQAFLLYEAGQDVYKIASVFSSGVLGTWAGRKLVPSRWSVTAIDGIIANKLLERIREYPPLSQYQVAEAQHLDNRFVILLMPGNWEFENFEAWAPGSNWAAQAGSRIIGEYEPFEGRTSYAESQAGGFYAARISVCRHLDALRRQARVVSFREVGEGYTLPLGVWLVRQVAEDAFREVRSFSTQEEALAHIRARLRLPLDAYQRQSRILRQRRLGEF